MRTVVLAIALLSTGCYPRPPLYPPELLLKEPLQDAGTDSRHARATFYALGDTQPGTPFAELERSLNALDPAPQLLYREIYADEQLYTYYLPPARLYVVVRDGVVVGVGRGVDP
jgi:hypothetical protein